MTQPVGTQCISDPCCCTADPSTCAVYRKAPTSTPVSLQCLAELWESLGCTNTAYILSDEQNSESSEVQYWSNLGLTAAYDSMFGVQQQALRVLNSPSTPWSQWGSQIIQDVSACYGLSRSLLIGAAYGGYAQFAKDFAVRCAPGHFVTKFTVSAELAIRSVIPVCDDGTTDGSTIVSIGSSIAASGNSDIVHSATGFTGIRLQVYQGSTVLQDKGSPTALYISGLSFISGNGTAVDWQGVYEANREVQEVRCSAGARVTGMAGLLLFDLIWGTSEYLPASLQAICQQYS